MILTFTQIKYKELISGGIRYVGPSIVQARQAAIGKTGEITKPRRRSKPASMCEAGGGVALSGRGERSAAGIPRLCHRLALRCRFVRGYAPEVESFRRVQAYIGSRPHPAPAAILKIDQCKSSGNR